MTSTPAEDDLLVDGVRLGYRYRQGRSGEVVVFVHGTPSHSMIWREVVPAIESDGHSVLVFDLLGYGRSERPLARDTSVEAQAALARAVFDRVGLDRVTFVGHDLGAAIGQLLAVDTPHRLRRLLLIDGVAYDSWPSPTWQHIIAEHLDAGWLLPAAEFDALLTRQLQMTVADPARMSDEILDAYLAPYRTAVGRLSFFEHQVRTYDSTPTQRVASLLSGIDLPVRLLWGSLDRWQPVATVAEPLAVDIPGATLTVVPDAGHFLPEEAPDRVVDEVRRLLATPAN